MNACAGLSAYCLLGSAVPNVIAGSQKRQAFVSCDCWKPLNLSLTKKPWRSRAVSRVDTAFILCTPADFWWVLFSTYKKQLDKREGQKSRITTRRKRGFAWCKWVKISWRFLKCFSENQTSGGALINIYRFLILELRTLTTPNRAEDSEQKKIFYIIVLVSPVANWSA